MGGFGSGRSWSGKPKVEQASRLDIASLIRNRFIVPRQQVSTPLTWTSSRDGSVTGSIGFRSWCDFDGEGNRIQLNGTYQDKPFTQTIFLTSIPGTKGGRRWFAICPASGRSCLKLVLSRKHGGWVSIPASGLRYCSEGEDYLDRCRSRVDRIATKQKKLSKYARIPTRHRLEKELWAAEYKWHDVLDVYRGKLNDRLARAGLTDRV